VGAPERLETRRLILRRPRIADAAAIHAYASDPEVTRWLGWPRHTTMRDTEQFLAFSDSEWSRWPAAAYVIERRDDERVIGGTGFGFETPWRAVTGYVLARESWGYGYATEALTAIRDLAPALGVQRLQAHCHIDHAASARVLDKCAFVREGVLARHTVFPNCGRDEPLDILSFARTW
jgi:ribosomal-protein-alanine N-acetyltransferase